MWMEVESLVLSEIIPFYRSCASSFLLTLCFQISSSETAIAKGSEQGRQGGVSMCSKFSGILPHLYWSSSFLSLIQPLLSLQKVGSAGLQFSLFPPPCSLRGFLNIKECRHAIFYLYFLVIPLSRETSVSTVPKRITGAADGALPTLQKPSLRAFSSLDVSLHLTLSVKS